MSPTVQESIIRLSFAVTGLIHILPLGGVVGRPALERAYGITLGEGNDLSDKKSLKVPKAVHFDRLQLNAKSAI